MASISLKNLHPLQFAKDYPRLKGNYRETSIETLSYNCVAYIFEEYETNYSSYPKDEGFIWLEGLDRTHTPENYAEFFRRKGKFERCSNPDLEEGIEKIAIFGEDNEFLHVALQLPNGQWTSKMGEYEDIVHYRLEVVGSGKYGEPVIFMKRNREKVFTFPSKEVSL